MIELNSFSIHERIRRFLLHLDNNQCPLPTWFGKENKLIVLFEWLKLTILSFIRKTKLLICLKTFSVPLYRRRSLLKESRWSICSLGENNSLVPFNNRWVPRVGPISCVPRSSDLSFWDFSLRETYWNNYLQNKN